MDFRDGLSMQSISTIIFLYFATLAPIVAFGGLLGDATNYRMASIEALVKLVVVMVFLMREMGSVVAFPPKVSGLIAGTMFGLLSGQPLTILGLTGPDLVFEVKSRALQGSLALCRGMICVLQALVSDFCGRLAWDYLSFRIWIGLWLAAMLIALVAFDAR